MEDTEDQSDLTCYQPWDHRFAFELALALEPSEEICERYEVSPQTFAKLRKNPAFMKQVVEYRAEIKEKGLTFRAKAKIMAEDLLNKAYEIINTPGTTAAVRADLIKWVGKMADYEPKPEPVKDPSVLYLPAVAEAISKMSDGDLELRVTQIVSKRAPLTIEHP